MERIEILKDHLSVGTRALKKGEIVPVSEIGEAAALNLVDTKRAKIVKAPSAGKDAEKNA